MPFADRDLIDGDLMQVFEFRPGEPTSQIAFLDVLDQIPADVQVFGHVLNRHVTQEIQRIALERLGVAPASIGKPDSHLADSLADRTFYPGDRKHDVHRLAADRQGLETPLRVPTASNIPRSARRAPQRVRLLADREKHLPVMVFRSHVGVAPNPESVVQ